MSRFEQNNITAKNAVAITPNDSADLTNHVHTLVVQVAGNIAVDTVGGQEAVVIGAAAGVPIHLQVKRVDATNTTATGIVGFY